MTSSHELWVTDDPHEAVHKAKITMKKVGALTKVVPHEHIEGDLSYSGSHVTLNISWRAETAQEAADAAGRRANEGSTPDATTKTAATASMGTTLILEATHTDKSGAAQKSAIERFEDAYMHFDRPDYAPDRLGIQPLTILSIVVAAVIIILVLILLPQIKKSLGVADPRPSVSSGATP